MKSQAITNLKRFPYQSVSAFLVQFFTAFLLLVILSSGLFLYAISKNIETQPQVVAYFKPQTPKKDILTIREFLVTSGKTTSVDFIDQQKAFAIYKSQVADNPVLLQEATSDVFPPSLEIKAKEAAYLDEIATYLKSARNIDEVQYQKSTVDKLVQITRSVRFWAFVTALYLCFMSVVVLSTLTSFKIAMRQSEIEISQLLGATSGFITGPLYAEAAYIALAATLTSTLCFVAGMLAAAGPISLYLGSEPLIAAFAGLNVVIWPYNPALIAIFVAITLMLSLLISGFATYVSSKKYTV